LQAWRDLEFELQDVLNAGGDVVALIRNQSASTAKLGEDQHLR
jgi:hypothetical protein